MVEKIEKNRSLSESVQASLDAYFSVIDEHNLPNNLYQTVLEQIEKPLITSVMRVCNYNQSKAAHVLGLNRNTLRKKILAYNIVKNTRNG